MRDRASSRQLACEEGVHIDTSLDPTHGLVRASPAGEIARGEQACSSLACYLLSSVVCCALVCSLGTLECWGGRQGGCGLELCVRQLRVCGSQAGCVSCEPVCVCVSLVPLVRAVIICPASTHTALVSSPSLAVLHLTTYIHTYDTGLGTGLARTGQEKNLNCMARTTLGSLKIPLWWRRAVLPSLPWVSVFFLSFFQRYTTEKNRDAREAYMTEWL